MKNVLIATLAASTFLSGCINQPHEHIVVEIPDDVESYIQYSEQQSGYIKPNNEKKIFWHTAVHDKSEYSIIYIHGFASSRLVHEPALSDLANKIQANYFATRITGHGQTSRSMMGSTVSKWLYDTQEAIEIGKKIGKKVIIVCHSTGCPAVIKQLSDQQQERIHAAIFIAPNYGPKNSLSEALLWPGGLNLAKQIKGPYSYIGKDKLTKRERELKRQFQKKIDACATEVYPIDAAHQVMLLVNQARNINPDNITIPMLIIYSPHDLSVSDTLIDNYTAKYRYATISKIHTTRDKVDISNHIQIGQFSNPSRSKILVQRIQDFLNAPMQKFDITVD